MPVWVATLLRLTPIVALASGGSVVGLIAWRELAPTDELKAASGEIGNYLQTVGAIYAVLLAFIVYVVWGQFNDLRVYIDREARALVDLHRTATGLPPDTRTSIQTSLRAYVDAVLRDEWLAMGAHDERAIEEVGDKLDQVWLAMHRCTPDGARQELMYGEALKAFNEVIDLRTSRLTSARFRVPLSMKILLYTGAVIIIGSMYLMYIDELWLHALVTAALSGAISHILYLIVDLDGAFVGNLQVSKVPFERARASFERVVRLIPVLPDE